jgi:hypothetical protein
MTAVGLISNDTAAMARRDCDRMNSFCPDDFAFDWVHGDGLLGVEI